MSKSRLVLAILGVAAAAVGGVQGSLLRLEETKHIFAFGDSYTLNGFSPLAGYNPLTQNLTSSSGGNSWVSYLSQTENASPELAENTYSFARGGATLNGNLTFGGYPNNSLSNQIDMFERWFTNNANSSEWETSQDELGGRPEWDGEESLFSIWFGINDLEIAYKRNESWPALYENTMFDVLDEMVGRLWYLGARHFLFHLVPPMWLSPLYLSGKRSNDSLAQAAVRENVQLWNDHVRELGAEVRTKWENASAMIWETEEWFEAILATPADFGFLNSTSYCDTYKAHLFETNSDPNVDDEEACGASLSEYFWIDETHPTWAVQELLAGAVANSLSPGEPSVPLSVSPEAATAGNDSGSISSVGDVAVENDDSLSPVESSSSTSDLLDGEDEATATERETEKEATAPAPVDPTVPSPISIPINPNAGVGYITLENGDTLPTGTVWTRHRRRAESDSSSQSIRRRPDWRKTRTRPTNAPTTRVPINPNEGLVYSTLPNGDTVPIAGAWTRKRGLEEEGEEEEVEGEADEEDAPAAMEITVKTDVYCTPRGCVVLRDSDKRVVEVAVEKRDNVKDDSSSSSSTASDSTSATPTARRRPNWRTAGYHHASPATATGESTSPVLPTAPLVPIVGLNAPLAYITLANGDTLPTAGVWARHRRSRRSPKETVRKIEPVMVHQEEREWRVLSEEGKGKRRMRREKKAAGAGEGSLWQEVRERLKESVTGPVGAGLQ
ncbi:hypothetical protein JCM8547_008915 [Rhodosporidiobolus lusitaniae]